MTKTEAKLEVFWVAFQSLPKTERKQVVHRLLRDSEFMEDLLDIALADSRRAEPTRPFEEYLAEQKRQSKVG